MNGATEEDARGFLEHWFEIWLEGGADEADRHFLNSSASALALARQSAYGFMDAFPDKVPAERWGDRRADETPGIGQARDAIDEFIKNTSDGDESADADYRQLLRDALIVAVDRSDPKRDQWLMWKHNLVGEPAGQVGQLLVHVREIVGKTGFLEGAWPC